MTLSDLKRKVDAAIEDAIERHESPDKIPVTLQIETTGSGHDAICAHEDLELHYDGGAQATGCVLCAWVSEDSATRQAPAKEPGQAVASHDLSAVGEIVENIGQAWCLCPCEWGIEDYITIQSSQGQLALCAVGRVVDGPNRGKLRHKPLTKGAIHDLSDNETSGGPPPSRAEIKQERHGGSHQ